MATTTYEPIETYTLGSAASSITFGTGGTIPQNYTDLIIVVTAAQTGGGSGDLALQFNSDTGSNYSPTNLSGGFGSASSVRFASATSMRLTNLAYLDSVIGTYIIQIQNYSNSTTFKTALTRGSNASSGVNLNAGLWRNTNAITSIKVLQTGTNATSITAGSTFTLYGIANADIGAKATGGVITYDNTYFYHTFGVSGTFTPTASLTADVLLVAGGGGGGSGIGGAGGAGGVRALASQSLTATAYAVTVGSGGGGGAGGSSFTNGTVGGNSSLIGGALSISASGGGYGGTGGSNAGGSGGSGGGGGGSGGTTGAGGSGNAGSYSPVEGYAGGAGNQGNSPNITGGGGGGAGAIGQTPNVSSGTGVGGIGATSTFINSIGTTAGVGYLSSGNYYFGAGGGGGNFNPPFVSGGIGGGGAGGNDQTPTINATNAVMNTGSGGGGGGYNGVSSGKGNGGNGGSGIVVVRYLK